MPAIPETPADALDVLATAFADAVPRVDATAEHDRWRPGLGPFEEEVQIRKLLVESGLSRHVETEVAYPNDSQRCDVVVQSAAGRVPVEAKLLRFRYDNGRVDPDAYGRIFSPVPESESSSLLTNAEKLRESDFDRSGGLLGLYYQRDDEPYAAIDPERMAEKFVCDVNYWYDSEVEVRRIERFDGLRHPVHQHGAVVVWELTA